MNPGGGFAIFGLVGGFILSGRLLRGVKPVEEGWEIETHIWGRLPHSIVAFSILFFGFFYFSSIFFNCAFYALYKENQGLAVPRERHLQK